MARARRGRWPPSLAAGDSQRLRSSIAADGTAALVWSSPSSAPHNAVRLATRDVRDPLSPWVGRDVVTGGVDTDAYVLAGRGGRATAFWRTTGASNPIWSRHFDGTALASPTQVTPSGEIAEFDALVPRPGGTAFLLYQRFGPGIFSLGLEVGTLVDGVASDPVTLTGDETTFGNTNSEQLSVDAAGRGMLMYTFGDYPDTNISWQAQLTSPAVMTGPATGVVVRRAKVTGRLPGRPHRRLHVGLLGRDERPLLSMDPRRTPDRRRDGQEVRRPPRRRGPRSRVPGRRQRLRPAADGAHQQAQDRRAIVGQEAIRRTLSCAPSWSQSTAASPSGAIAMWKPSRTSRYGETVSRGVQAPPWAK